MPINRNRKLGLTGELMLTAGDVMTSMVISVSEDVPVSKAVSLLAKNHISTLPVVDSSYSPVGILTEKGVLSLLYAESDDENKSVSEFMSSDVVCFDEHDDLSSVCDYLMSTPFHAVPITSGGKLVGVVSVADVVDYIIHRQLKRYYIY